MNSVVPLLIWCVLQVTVISATGVLLCRSLAPRYPRLAATSTIAATLMIFVSTFAILFPLPRWSLETKSDGNKQASSLVSAHTTESDPHRPVGHRSLALVDLEKFSSLLASTIQEQQETVSRRPLLTRVLLLGAAGMLVAGLVRFGLSLHYLAKLRRQSEPINDASLSALLRKLQEETSIKVDLQLRASNQVQSAAVIGSFAPTIVLASSWTSWTPKQLRAVLAHELAHVRHRDFSWRLLSALSAAVHFYNPFAHWLLQQLAYSQEIAADQYAAALVGDRTSYSKVLSQLAISQDEASRLHPAPLLLPTMSNDLIRRIKMVRAKECLEFGRTHLAARAAIALLVVLIGFGVTAFRGYADSVDAEPSPQLAAVVGEQTSAAMLHHREPSIPLVYTENDKGIFQLKVAELLQCNSLQPYLPALKQAAESGWQELFSSAKSPNIDFAAIESISGQLVVKVTASKPGEDSEDGKHSGRLMLGVAHAIVRFKGEIPNWDDWVRTNIPACEEIQSSHGTAFRLPVIPAIGPEPATVAAFDNRTLLILVDESFPSSIDDLELQQGAGLWNVAWNSIDRGLLSMLVSTSGLNIQEDDTLSPRAQKVKELLANCHQIGGSIDLNGEYWQTGVKVQFFCGDREAADKLSSGIGTLTELQLADIESELEELESANTEASATDDSLASRKQAVETLNLLRSIQPKTIVADNGEAVVELFVPWDLPAPQVSKQPEIARTPPTKTKK